MDEIITEPGNIRRSHRDTWIFAGLLFVLCWAPLPFGSSRPWGSSILFLLTAILLAWWLALLVAGKVEIRERIWRRLRLPLLLLLAVQAWVMVQLLPLPRSVVALLSPRAEALHLAGNFITITLDPEQTRFYLLQGLTYTAAFFLFAATLNSRKRIEIFLWALALSGTFQAVYGSLMMLSGIEYGFFVEKYTGQGLATGTFINRNHLSGYLVMCLAAGIGLMIARMGEVRRLRAALGFKSVLRLIFTEKFLLRLMLVVMVVGLVLTRSRMGNTAFFFSLAIAATIAVAGARVQVSRNMLILLFSSLFLIDMLIVGQWFGVEEVAERIMQTSADTESRDEVSRFSLDLLLDYAWTGSGGGSYYTVLPQYSSQELDGDYYNHAHNDFLELAGNLGIPAFLVLCAFVVLAFRNTLFLEKQSVERREVGRAFTVHMAICWLGFHSVVDFNLHIAANAYTLAALLALGWADTRRGASKNGVPASWTPQFGKFSRGLDTQVRENFLGTRQSENL
jgi:O-antigen ligase